MLELNFDPFPELITERLVLRQPNEKDANDFFAIRPDKKVMQYMDRPLAQSAEDATDLIKKLMIP